MPVDALLIEKSDDPLSPWQIRVWQNGVNYVVPGSLCRLKREAAALRERLMRVANWSVPFYEWSEIELAAVLGILAEPDDVRVLHGLWLKQTRKRRPATPPLSDRSNP
jgi:hypothetical protein